MKTKSISLDPQVDLTTKSRTSHADMNLEGYS